MLAFAPSLLSLALLPLISASESRAVVYQRFLPSALTENSPSFIPLGSISIPEQSYRLIEKIPSSEPPAAVSRDDDGTGWYQVGLQLHDDDESADWLIASTRSCYLATPPIIRLQLDKGQPVSISVHPAPAASCSAEAVNLPKGIEDIQVELFVSEKTLLPPLGAPPVVDSTTGAPVVPPPEKSFLQKYWMYIVGLALFFAVQMGPDEPRGGANGGK